MDWIKEAKKKFAAKKPQHFTDFNHCAECAEHDKTLLASSIDQIGMNELGNPGWDPLCFCSAPGIDYYIPALLRLSLDTVTNEFYFEQLLFHLEYSGKENRFLKYCSSSQREFIASFIEHMISTYPEEIEESMCTTEALNTYELWKSA
ncbi:MAG: hypothetical protein HKN34_07045 [Gammaproteobacteria bacterium]|nr:hypothetical protein [Gammaproteobacteria bacterium]